MAKKPTLKIGTALSQCGGCGLRFTGIGPFDRHRVGPQDARRCLTVEQMIALGMRRNEGGYWEYGISEREAQRQALAKLANTP